MPLAVKQDEHDAELISLEWHELVWIEHRDRLFIDDVYLCGPRVGAIRDVSADMSFAIVESSVVKVHADERLVAPDRRHVLPNQWRPLIYDFRRYFGLGAELGRSFRSVVR